MVALSRQASTWARVSRSDSVGLAWQLGAQRTLAPLKMYLSVQSLPSVSSSQSLSESPSLSRGAQPKAAPMPSGSALAQSSLVKVLLPQPASAALRLAFPRHVLARAGRAG